MNRRAVTMVLIVMGTIGSLSVLAQQSYQQTTPPQVPPSSTHHDPVGYHHSDGVSYEAERSALISRHLVVARAQLQEARREIDPSARIDRLITALDELITGLEYIEGGSTPAFVGVSDHHQGLGAPAAVHGGGGCN